MDKESLIRHLWEEYIRNNIGDVDTKLMWLFFSSWSKEYYKKYGILPSYRDLPKFWRDLNAGHWYLIHLQNRHCCICKYAKHIVEDVFYCRKLDIDVSYDETCRYFKLDETNSFIERYPELLRYNPPSPVKPSFHIDKKELYNQIKYAQSYEFRNSPSFDNWLKEEVDRQIRFRKERYNKMWG